MQRFSVFRRTVRPVAPADVDGPAATPPDGGFGWVVVLASFCIGVVVDGFMFNQGLFLVPIREAFDTSTSVASAVTSVLSGTYLLTGPLDAGLANRFGCRKVAMCGAVMAAAAIAVAPLHLNVYSMILLFSVVCGVAFGMMMLPAIVMVGYYFDEHRAVATGIACSGSGVGTLVIAHMSDFLLEKFGWKGAYWWLSGVVFLAFFFSMLFRPLTRPYVLTEEEEENGDDSDGGIIGQNEVEVNPDSAKVASLASIDDPAKVPFEYIDADGTLLDNVTLALGGSIFTKNNGRFQDQVKKSRSLGSSIDKDKDSPKIPLRNSTSAFVASKSTSTRKLEVIPPLQKNDIFYTGSLKSLPRHTPSAPSLVNIRKDNDDDSDMNESKKKKSRSAKCAKTLNKLFGFHLLKSSTLILYIACNLLSMFGLIIPFIYLPDHVYNTVCNHSDKKNLISAIGVANTIGRVAVGILANSPCVSATLLQAVCLMVTGLATFCVGFIPGEQVWMFYVYTAVFGIGFAAFISLRSIIVAEIMGLENLTAGFGLVSFVGGMASMICAPVGGLLMRGSGDYTFTFYMAGVCIFLSGVVCLPLWCVAKGKRTGGLCTDAAPRASGIIMLE